MTIYFQFHSQIKADEFSASSISLDSPQVRLHYSNPSKGLQGCLSLLANKGAPLDKLIELWERESGPDSLAHFYFVLEELRRHRFLSYTAYGENGPLATLHPFANFTWKETPLSNRVRLSRFAYLHLEGENFVLESPLAFAKLEIFDPRTIEMLMSPSALLESPVHELLHRGNFLETEEESLKIWEFHDLLFHSRSRKGRHDNPSGGTFRFLGKLPPWPPLRPSEGEAMIPLPKGEGERDIPFCRVLEARRTIREYGERPITVEQLGEFLFLSAAVRRTGKSEKYETLYRTTPSGGACHPIEIYPLIANCEGLEPGLYRYHRLEHSLSLLTPFSEELQDLLRIPEAMLEKGAKVQVLFIFAARFGRTLWKYQSMAYGAILKDVGALMQTMYLVATAMDLAPCANGTGDSDLFARCSGLDYFSEGSVGEFILGSKCSS